MRPISPNPGGKITVAHDEAMTWRVGGGKEGKVHTRYYRCHRGGLGYDCAVSMSAAAMRAMGWESDEQVADRIARELAGEAFRRHGGGAEGAQNGQEGAEGKPEGAKSARKP